jgi:amidase
MPGYELLDLDCTALAELVRRREVEPIELVELSIARIERLDPGLGAVVTPMYDEARAATAAGIPDGPFTGVPFLIKDLLGECAGVRHEGGSAFLAGYVPPVDSELVRRYRQAGLVLIGKTSTSELGIGPTCEPAVARPTANPWDPTRMAGGSSGGAAVAVAARMVPAAHANDAAGSIRVPASTCGVFGLKPTRGRITLGPVYGDLMSGMIVEHAITRSVRDSAALLDCTLGDLPGDPYREAGPARAYRDEVGRDPGRLRVAVSVAAPLGHEVDGDCVGAVRDAARLCESLGHEVSEAAPAIDGEALAAAFGTVLAGGIAFTVAHWARRTGRRPVAEAFEPFSWAVIEAGRKVSAADYLLAVWDIQRHARTVAAFFADHDVWLTPTLGELPPELGAFRYAGGDPALLRRRMNRFNAFCWVSNATGQPAMTVPLHWNADGLPVGSHFVGRHGDEATLFRLAAQLEAARPWAGRRPAALDVTP